MLFTDSDIVTSDMLMQIDNEVLTVANSGKPSVSVDGPGSICEQAWRECGQRITSAQQLYSTYLAQPGMTSGHLAAVLNVGIPARTQPRCRLNQIVAHDPNYAASFSAIQLWMIYTALALFFRNASSRLGKDRFEEKMKRFREDAQSQWRQLRATGLPMVYQPMEAPGAKHSYAAGAWGLSNLSSVAGGSSTQQQVAVAITWYDASKYTSQTNKGNAESAPSGVLTYSINPNSTLAVDIASLNPPTGAMDPVGTSSGTWLPLNATHWNIYAGATPDAMYLQQGGIPIATKTFTLAGAPVFSGSIMRQGQWADLNIVFQNTVSRG
jgi:hypothetical protein